MDESNHLFVKGFQFDKSSDHVRNGLLKYTDHFQSI